MGSATQPVASTAWSTVATFYVSFCIRNSVLVLPQYLGYAFSVHSSLIYPVPCHLLLLIIGPNMSLIQIHCLSSPDSDPYPVPHLAFFSAPNPKTDTAAVTEQSPVSGREPDSMSTSVSFPDPNSPALFSVHVCDVFHMSISCHFLLHQCQVLSDLVLVITLVSLCQSQPLFIPQCQLQPLYLFLISIPASVTSLLLVTTSGPSIAYVHSSILVIASYFFHTIGFAASPSSAL